MSLAISRSKYTGDYMGDPGIFGDIFGGIKGAIGGAFRGFTGLGRQPAAPTAGPGSYPIRSFAPQTNGPKLRIDPSAIFPGGRPFVSCPPSGASANGSMSGYRLNKSDYFLRSGEFVPAGTKWVKIRRRNPANARATSRAISRITGAKTYAKSLGRISIRKKC